MLSATNGGSTTDDPKVMKEAARKELLPGEDCRLRPYFTTRRSYFGTPGEEILED